MKLQDIMNPNLIRIRTREARGGDKATFPDKALEVAAIIDASDFGCQQANVRKLVSAMMGLELPPIEKNEEFELGTLVEYNEKTYLVSNIDEDGDSRLMDHKGRITEFVGPGEDWTISSDDRVERFIRKAFGDGGDDE